MTVNSNNLNEFLKKKLVTEDNINNNMSTNSNTCDPVKYDNYNENAIHKVKI
jgi:hypothetical protein